MPHPPRRFRFPRLFWLREQHPVDEEFAHHLEMKAKELAASGLSADEAREEAQRQFGDVEDARNYCNNADTHRVRRARFALFVDETLQDLRYAVRHLARNKAFTVATISILAMGLALFIAALSVADAYLMRGLPFPDAQRLVAVRAGPTAEFFDRMPNLQNVDWQIPEREFDGVVRWDLDGFTIMGGEHPMFADGAWVSQGYFDVLGVRPSLGRAFDSTEYAGTARVAIISHGLWQRRFGGRADVIGSSVRMFSIDRPAEQELVTIVGVLPSDAWHVNRFTDILRPLTTPRTFYMARLKPGASIATATARLNAAVLPQVPNHDPAWSMSLASLHDDYVRQARPAILALLGGATLILLIVITNAAGMSAVRSARRAGEFAVRAALGAGRSRIARQTIVESLVLTGFAAVIGLGTARVLTERAGPAIEQRLGATVPGGGAFLQFDWRLVAMSVAAVVLAALTAAWRSTRVHRAPLNVNLRPGETSVRSIAHARNVLIGGQIACTLALLTGAAFMARTAWNVTHEPLGFETRHVHIGTVLVPRSAYPSDSQRIEATTRMLSTVNDLPGVASAAAAWPPPFYGGAPVPARTDGGANTRARDAHRTWVSSSYFATLGIPLRAGRVFTANDRRSSEPVVMIDERLAGALWPNGSALGARLRLGDEPEAPWHTVIGVVASVKTSVQPTPMAEVYLPLSQNPLAFISLMTRWKGNVSGNPDDVKSAIASVHETLAWSNDQPLSTVVNAHSMLPRSLSLLLVIFSSFGLMLSALGLGSSIAHAVAQRKPEIALRLALGASPVRIFGMIVRDTAALLAVSVAAGLLMSVAVGRALAAQLYGLAPTDPLTYAGALALVVTVSLAAAVIPARRAAVVDPARTLRGD